MESTTLLAPGTRVIDIGAPDPSLAEDLAKHGSVRYLGLVCPRRVNAIREAAGDRASRFHPLPSIDVAQRCSADLLILRAPYTRALWAATDLSHFRFVAVERSARALASPAAAVVGRVTRRLLARGRHQWGGTTFDVFELPARRGPEPRTYFSLVWGAAGLASRLREADIRYAVLRWFEDLPTIAAGEDLDILVADDDVERLRALVELEPGTQPLDLYSVSGLDYSDYQDSAYYPPPLAAKLLSGAIVHSSGFLVPAPQDHLHSLAYHAVYHKGPRAGLNSRSLGRAVPNPEHDYTAALTGLGAALGVEMPTTFEDVDRYLASVGWRPPEDALRRLSSSNEWVSALLPEREGTPRGGPEVAAFLVRREALRVVTPDEVLRKLDHFGFDVLYSGMLDDETRARTAASLRGGNWGRGPFPRSGGDPAMLVLALHYAPSAPYPWLHERYPHLTNAETYEAKTALRHMVEQRVSEPERFNPVHSSDDELEAWEYAEVVMPGRTSHLRDAARLRAAAYTPPPALIRNLSMGRRSRVDVVDVDGRHVVRKTYVPAFRRFLERELEGIRALTGRVAAVPQVLDASDLSFTMPLYSNLLDDQERPSPRYLPISVLREMVGVLRDIYDLGYDVVDAKPQNFLLDRNEGLRLVDLEFLHRYGPERPRFARSANFVGPWPGFEGDVPVGDMTYESRWWPWTGLPLDALVEGSSLAQRFQQTASRARMATISRESLPRRAASRLRSAGRHSRWLFRKQYEQWARGRAWDAPADGGTADVDQV